MFKITNPITGAELLVANEDFSEILDWEQAKKACIELGIGWRLPTREELKAMHEQLHLNGEGNFKDETYWSITEDDDYYGAYYFDFMNVDAHLSDVIFPNNVRAVKDL